MNNIIRKIICTLLVVAFILGLCGCNETGKKPDNTSSASSNLDDTTAEEENLDEDFDGELDEESEDDWDDEDWEDDWSDEDWDDWDDEESFEDEDWEEDYEDDWDDWEDDEDSDSVYTSAVMTVKNGSSPVQSNFWGFNAVYHGFALMSNKLGRTHTLDQAEAEWDAVEKSGINVARTYFTEDWCYTQQGDDWVLNLENDEATNQRMWAFYTWAKAMQDRDIEVHISYWYGHSRLYYQFWHNGKYQYVGDKSNPFYTKTGGEYDQQATFNKYADFIVELYKQCRALGLNNVNYYSISTEPGYWISNDMTDEDAHLRAKEVATDLLNAAGTVSEALKTAGLRSGIKFIGPNEANNVGNNEDALLLKYTYELDTNNVFDYYSSHTYNSVNDPISDNYLKSDTDIKSKLAAMNNDKDRFIFDEYNTFYNSSGSEKLLFAKHNPYAGSLIAQQWVAQLNNGIKGSYLWSLVDQQWPDVQGSNDDSFVDGVHETGILPNYQVSTVPHYSFYAFQLVANYLGVRGSKIYTCDYSGDAEFSQVYVAMAELPDGNISILVVSTNVFAVNLKLNFEKAIGKTLYRHEYNPETVKKAETTEIIPASAKITNCQDSFVDVIPSMGVTVYTTVKD